MKHTNRLTFKKAEKEDIQTLFSIFDSQQNLEQDDVVFKKVNISEIEALVNLQEENPKFRIRLVYMNDMKKAIGYFHFFEQVPDNESVFISMLLIEKQFQKQKLGQEIFDSFQKELQENGQFKRIVLKVSSLNINALQFWVKQGFTHIQEIKIRGLEERNQCDLILYKYIK